MFKSSGGTILLSRVLAACLLAGIVVLVLVFWTFQSRAPERAVTGGSPVANESAPEPSLPADASQIVAPAAGTAKTLTLSGRLEAGRTNLTADGLERMRPLAVDFIPDGPDRGAFEIICGFKNVDAAPPEKLSARIRFVGAKDEVLLDQVLTINVRESRERDKKYIVTVPRITIPKFSVILGPEVIHNAPSYEVQLWEE